MNACLDSRQEKEDTLQDDPNQKAPHKDWQAQYNRKSSATKAHETICRIKKD